MFRDYIQPEVQPSYIADQAPIVGKSYAEIASDTSGDVGEYIYNNPKQAAIDSARGLGSLLVGDFAQTGEIADFDLFGGIQDAGEQVYDSAKTLLSNDYFGNKYKDTIDHDVYERHMENMATNPEYATAYREEAGRHCDCCGRRSSCEACSSGSWFCD